MHICGEVVNEGVYEVEKGTRIYELIEMAGGLTEEAASEGVNQARVLEDGEQIIICTKEELESSSSGESEFININRADVNGLCQIPGIGESRANDIIKYRDEQGGFSTVDDIMKVPGIKAGTYEKIKEYIVVN